LKGIIETQNILAFKACTSSERLFSIYRDYIEYKITSNF